MKDFFGRLLGRGNSPSERRRSPRYATVTNAAFLAWPERVPKFLSPGRLLNISSMGAFVLADGVPLEGHAVWLRLEAPEPTGWVKVRVVRRAGFRKVGLDFLEHCPHHFLNAATQGADHVPAVPPQLAEGYRRG